MRHTLKKAIVALLVCLALAALSFSAAAATPYDNYIYEQDNNSLLPSPLGAVPGRVVNGPAIGSGVLKNPQDLYVDTKGFLYVADSGNNRILKLDGNYTLIKEYAEFIGETGETDRFSNPCGLYADAQGNLLVADTGNARLVRLDVEGNLLAVYGAPVSQMLPSNFEYKPFKVISDTAGRIFVASRGFNRGLLELDRQGLFVQMLGASEATYSFADRIWRMFSTKAQIDRMAAFVPSEYNNISIDQEDFLFVTTGSETTTPIRRINAQGNDVLRREEGNPVGDAKTNTTGSVKGPSVLVDVVNLDNGMYAALDQKRARVFVYDQNGQMLFLFGGLGQTYGTTLLPTSLVWFQNEFLILDASKNAIVTYRLTEYGETLMLAERYRDTNEFDKEQAAWKRVLELNENNPLVLREMGKIAYRQRDMETAMSYFRKAKDVEDYSKAFKFHRRALINQYFTVGGVTVIVLIIFLLTWKIFIKQYRKSYPKPEKQQGPLRYAFYVIFRPMDGFWDLKHENRGSLKAALILMGLTGGAFIFRTQATGFIFNQQSVSFLVDLAALFVPLILWIASSWCVTSLLSGEGSFKDIVIANGYALTPLWIMLPTAALISNMLSADESGIVSLLVALGYIWMAMLMIAAVKQTHNFTFGKTMGVVFLTLLVIVIIVFLALLCTALVQQMAAFAGDLWSEIMNRV